MKTRTTTGKLDIYAKFRDNSGVGLNPGQGTHFVYSGTVHLEENPGRLSAVELTNELNTLGNVWIDAFTREAIHGVRSGVRMTYT